MTHITPILNQQAFRARANSGAVNDAPTWLANLNTNWTQNVDTSFRVRFLVQETAGATTSPSLVVQYNRNSTGWAAVTGSTPVQFATPVGATDGDSITVRRLGAGTFVNGSLDSNGTVASVTLLSQETEMEYVLSIDSAQVVNNDSIQLRVTNGATQLGTYTNTPTITAKIPRELIAESASYVVSGGDTWGTGTWGTSRWDVPSAVLLRGYVTAAGAGSYAVTGTEATLTASGGEAAALLADGGSYSVTGTAASLEWGREVAAGAGSYAVTGTAASLERGYLVAAESGTYSLTGTAASLEYGYAITLDGGTYALLGSDALLEYGYALAAGGGSYGVSGTDAALTYTPAEADQPPRSGGWLPVIYVDRDGNPVLDEQPVEAVSPPKPARKQAAPRQTVSVSDVAKALQTSVDTDLVEVTNAIRAIEAELYEAMRAAERRKLEAEWREYQRQQQVLIEQWRAEQQRIADEEYALFVHNQNAIAALLLID